MRDLRERVPALHLVRAGMTSYSGPTIEQIDAWRHASSEDQHLEFKAARTQFDHCRLREYCVALANEGGGYLLLGISDEPPRVVVGTQAFPDRVVIAERLYTALGFRVDVHEIQHPEGRVLVFEAPSRPPGTAYHLEGRYLMRSGGSLVAMSEDRLRAIFSEAKRHWLTQSFARGLSIDEVSRLLDTASYFELLKLPQPNTLQASVERMVTEAIVLKEPTGYAITNLGQIMFARNLTRFEDVGRKTPRVIRYAGKNKLDTIRDHTVERGYAASFENLVEVVELQTPAREIIERALRREERAYPLIAIRELIANALIHQDLAMSGASVMIELYSDRIEITNPGQPAVQPDRFIDGYRCRNEPMADLMRRFGISEEKGSGIDKVFRAVEEYHLPAPEYRVDSISTTCILHGPREFVDMSRSDRIRACYQHCCLRYISGELMTNRSLRERFGLSDRQHGSVTHVIADAHAAGRIKLDPASRKSNRYARYLPFWA